MAPSWNSTGATEEESEPFAFTGAPKHMQSIWESQWDWLNGRDTTAKSEDDAEVQALGAVLCAEDSSESERVGSAYELGAVGSGAAVAALAAGAVASAEGIRRASMYGLASAGDSAVPTLLKLLEHDEDNVANHAAHALGEAARQPTLAVIHGRHSCVTSRQVIRHSCLRFVGLF